MSSIEISAEFGLSHDRCRIAHLGEIQLVWERMELIVKARFAP
jgi:hypothetical protein